MQTVDLITMGCSKNLVDSERLLYMFKNAGFRVFHNPKILHRDIAVVNTCGFINDAKTESIEMILNLAERKKQGRLNKLCVMGCLSERYMEELRKEIPEVDCFYGKFNWPLLLNELKIQRTASACQQQELKRILTTPKHYAYIKISEGCDRHCAYCAIPIITGRHRSRPIEDILKEVEELVAGGTHEFQIIAQELTFYGVDLYKERKIAQLVERMADIKGVKWIRLHYAYPTDFPLDLLKVMKEKNNVCHYLDIALQHSSTSVLDKMHRNITATQQKHLIEEIRRQVPDIALRTTFMVGYPGETDEDFKNLLDFVSEMKFERMGAFAYSEEENTPAALKYADTISEDVKQQRLDKLMALQQEISTEIMAKKIGSIMEVVVDEREGDYYIGRTQFDSPEVDGVVYITPPINKQLRKGCFYKVKITDANEFDLYGSIIKQ